MSKKRLQRLYANGCSILASERDIIELTRMAYFQPSQGGPQPVLVDIANLPRKGHVYADSALQSGLRRSNVKPKDLDEAWKLVCGQLRGGSSLVLGFAGSMDAGRPYDREAKGMKFLLGCLGKMGEYPQLITDSGVSDGIPGISGEVAWSYGVPSLGFIPWEGLTAIGCRNHLVVHMYTHRECERLTSLVPDLLVCVGGGEETWRVCERAIGHGSAVLIMELRSDFHPRSPLALCHSPSLKAAADEGRFLTVRHVQDIRFVAGQAVAAARQWGVPRREERIAALRHLL